MNIINEKIIHTILAHKNNPNSKITHLKWTPCDTHLETANNFMSQIFKFVIEYHENNTPRKKFIILKIPSVNSPRYQDGLKYGMYQKEFIMYTEMLPYIYAIDNEHLTPRFYYADDNNLSLYIQDLSQSDYRIVNYTERLDFQHCTHALQCLAKLHAFSVKANEIRRIPEPLIKDALYDYEMRDQIHDFISSGFDHFTDHLQPDIKQQYRTQIDLFKNFSWTEIVDDVTPQADGFNVLNHGDFNATNILFKYDKYGIIKKTKMIDFQQSRWTSPAVDLIYFFISSVDFETFIKHFHLLRRIYLDTLNKILTTLNCSTYRMENLEGDIQKRGCYAIYVITCLLPFTHSESTHHRDNSTVHLNAFKSENYMKNATKWFLHFAQNPDTFQFAGKQNDHTPKENNFQQALLH